MAESGRSIRRDAVEPAHPKHKENASGFRLSFTPEEVETAHRSLAEAFSRGKLDRQRYLVICNAMKFADEYGRIWSIGLRSGKWYYNVNFRWFEGEPHSLLHRLESALPICLHCGDSAPSRRASYCISCGRPLHSLPSPDTIFPVNPGTVAGEVRQRRYLLPLVLLAAALALALLAFLLLRGGWLTGSAALGWMLPAASAPFTAGLHRRSGT